MNKTFCSLAVFVSFLVPSFAYAIGCAQPSYSSYFLLHLAGFVLVTTAIIASLKTYLYRKIFPGIKFKRLFFFNLTPGILAFALFPYVASKPAVYIFLLIFPGFLFFLLERWGLWKYRDAASPRDGYLCLIKGSVLSIVVLFVVLVIFSLNPYIFNSRMGLGFC